MHKGNVFQIRRCCLFFPPATNVFFYIPRVQHPALPSWTGALQACGLPNPDPGDVPGCVLCRQPQAGGVSKPSSSLWWKLPAMCVLSSVRVLPQPARYSWRDGAADRGNISFSYCSTRLATLIYLPFIFLPLFPCLLWSSVHPAPLFPCACSCCRNSFGGLL